MRKYWPIYYALSAALLFSLCSFLGNYFPPVNMIAVAALSLAVLVSSVEPAKAIFFVLFFAFFADLYSALPFGLFLVVFWLVSFLIEFLFFNFFTNRSFYSFLFLGITAIAAANIFFAALTWLFYLFNWINIGVGADFWFNPLRQIFVGAILLSFFFFINRRSYRFKPIFLE